MQMIVSNNSMQAENELHIITKRPEAPNHPSDRYRPLLQQLEFAAIVPSPPDLLHGYRPRPDTPKAQRINQSQ